MIYYPHYSFQKYKGIKHPNFYSKKEKSKVDTINQYKHFLAEIINE